MYKPIHENRYEAPAPIITLKLRSFSSGGETDSPRLTGMSSCPNNDHIRGLIPLLSR